MPRIDESQFTVEDLRSMGFIQKDGRPSDNMTDKLWQPVFKQIKKKNVPFIDGYKKRMKYQYIKPIIDEDGNFLPDQTTCYQRYCMFINSTLREIRQGKIAYAYYLHQIYVLLRFHSNLKTKFKDYYWEVWLDKEN